MSETSSKPRHGTGMTGHPALSRKVTRKHDHGAVGKSMVSETSSVITSLTHPPNYHANTKYENTYRMEPNEDRKFRAGSKVHDATYSILESYLGDAIYDAERTPELTKDLTELIKKRVKEMDFERYKLVVSLIMGEDTGQGLEMASRFLWNTNTDNYVTVTYKNGKLFAVATIYGVFFE